MPIDQIKEQAKAALVSATEASPNIPLPAAYRANKLPDLSWTIMVAEQLGLTVRIVIEEQGTV